MGRGGFCNDAVRFHVSACCILLRLCCCSRSSARLRLANGQEDRLIWCHQWIGERLDSIMHVARGVNVSLLTKHRHNPQDLRAMLPQPGQNAREMKQHPTLTNAPHTHHALCNNTDDVKQITSEIDLPIVCAVHKDYPTLWTQHAVRTAANSYPLVVSMAVSMYP